MKKKRKTARKRGIRPSAFALAVCLSVSSVWADGFATQVMAAEETGDLNPSADTDITFEADGVTYREIEPGKAELADGKGLSGDIVIPETVSNGGTEYTVVSVGDGAFYDISALTSVSFPDTITRIGERAFYCAFQYECGASLTLPQNLRVIGSEAFWLSYLCGHLDIPDSVTQIGQGAFVSNCFETITIHNPDIRMEAEVFRYNEQLTTVTLPQRLTRLEESTFELCTGLKQITLPDTLTEIGNGAFRYCTELEQITLPDTLTEIGNNAFYFCTGLKQITLPDTLTEIGDSAFYYCSGLREVIIPEGVTQLPGNCFAQCANLAVTLPDTIKMVDTEAFANVSDTVTVICTSSRAALAAYHAGVQNIMLNGAAFEPVETVFETSEYQFAVTDDENFSVRLVKYVGGDRENLEIPATVESPGSGRTYTITEIGKSAFEEKSGLTGTLRIPDTVLEIGEDCFCDCRGLTGIKLPENLTFMGRNAFAICGNLTGTLYIPESLSIISDNAFYHCTSLTGLVLSDSVTEIGIAAFDGCVGLKGTLNIPDSVTKIGMSAFQGCASLEGTLNIPDSVTEIGGSAFSGCTGLEGTLNIPDSVTEIGEYAFSECTGLEGTLNIPDSVTKIGEYAFWECDSLSRIQIGKGLNQLGDLAFPYGAELGTYSERVWQLLAENTSSMEEGSLVLLWDGKTDIPADTSVSVWDTVVVSGSAAIGEGAVLTIDPGVSVTVDGTLINNGTIAGEGRFLVNGSVEGNGTVNNAMDIQFTLAADMAEAVNDSSYTGTAITPEPKVSVLLCGKEIVFEKDKDFTYSYENNISPGQAKVIITPAESGRLKGEPITRTFMINKLDQEEVECTLDFTLNEDGKTYTAVIGEVDGAEYSFDGMTWSENNQKADCQPGVAYTAYIRRKETATHNAGPAAQITKTTKKLEQEVPPGTDPPSETNPNNTSGGGVQMARE